MPEQEGFSCGLEVACVPDLNAALKAAHQEEFAFIVAPLAHPRYHRDFTGKVPRSEPFTRSDLLLSSSEWSRTVVGKVSTWLNFESSSDAVRINAEGALKQELSWASHLGLPAILVPTPNYDCGNYGRALNAMLQSISCMSVWVHIPLTRASCDDDCLGSDEADLQQETWEAWNRLRTLAEYSTNLVVCLELTGDLPSGDKLDKWLAEPVKAVIIPTSIFLTNKSGYPTLSKKHQAILLKLFKTRAQYVMKGLPNHADGWRAYLMYLQHLWAKTGPMTDQEKFEAPYIDYLQAPLQPLMDNLESSTYETFEQDPVKYVQYEEAVFRALTERFAEQRDIVLMVVGAGRGPLVKASLAAAKRASKPIEVYAVEKNPNAVVTLQNLKKTEWGDAVSVVSCDMREWDAPKKADILVSELLGSFGDNELSPECLDGAQRFLQPKGISIPCQYMSQLAPLQSSKLWQEVKSYKDLEHFETSYVVKMQNVKRLAEPQDCFEFEHPNWADRIDNSRYKKLLFDVAENSTLHGFAGYFDAKLYGDVHISINPATFSDGMFSWFPLYFPLQVPMYVPVNSVVEVHFWRCVAPRKVWYEWAVTSPDITNVHNPNGRSHWIGL